MITVINGPKLVELFEGGRRNLLIHKTIVDKLNVFPVPDGDTGTNMGLTMSSLVRHAREASDSDAATIAEAMARGALHGAAGNSGVILSQIVKGMSDVIKEAKILNTRVFAKSLEAGANKAYDDVKVPKEGTILTVIRVVAAYATRISSRVGDFDEFFRKILATGNKILSETPKMLPILAKAGVVDSGGQGLMYILEGMHNALIGKEMAEVPELPAPEPIDEEPLELEDIRYTYCTEFFIVNMKASTTLADIDKFRDRLMKIGDCVLVVGDLEMVKVHVHTNNPDLALGYALQLGELNDFDIDNMVEQHRRLAGKKKAERKPIGLLAICPGSGFRKVFGEFGADAVLDGGQTMNPTVESIAKKVEEINADTVFVLPNNKNIILACEQASNALSDARLVIVPTRNVAEGVSAAIAYFPESTIEENVENMTEATGAVRCIQITHAVRKTEIDGFSIKEGEVIALEDSVMAKGIEPNEVALDALRRLDAEEIGTVVIFYGDGIDEEYAERLQNMVIDAFPDTDVSICRGGQPHYSYFISVE